MTTQALGSQQMCLHY